MKQPFASMCQAASNKTAKQATPSEAVTMPQAQTPYLMKVRWFISASLFRHYGRSGDMMGSLDGPAKRTHVERVLWDICGTGKEVAELLLRREDHSCAEADVFACRAGPKTLTRARPWHSFPFA